MKSIADIKHRIVSVTETEKITSAMETVSVIKMRRYLQKCDNNREYFESIQESVKSIAHCFESFGLPNSRATGKKLAVVITSDKGLCGDYNNAVIKFALKSLNPNDTVYAIGRVGADRLARSFNVNTDFINEVYQPTYSGACALATELVSHYADYDGIDIYFTNMKNHAVFEPRCIHLLPLSNESDGKIINYDVYPSAEEVLDKIISEYFSGTIYGALLNAIASEHCARHNAMSSSNKNAKEMIKKLTTQYNRARQERVTSEIIEIAGSSSAITKKEGL